MKKIYLLLSFLSLICISCKEDVPDNITNNITNNYTFEDKQFWERTNGPYSSYIYNLKIIGTDIYVFTSTGLYLNQDSGKKWVNIPYITPSDVINSMIVTNSKEIYVYGTYLTTLYITGDNGKNWTSTKINIDQAYGFTLSGFSKSGAIFAVVIKQGGANYLCRSTDKGANWTPVDSNGNSQFYSFYNGGNNLFTSKKGASYSEQQNVISVSKDDGITWNEICRNKKEFSSDAIFRSDKDGIFYIVSGCVYRSTNKGILWDKMTTGLYTETTSDVAISPKNTIYILTSGGIYKSNNKGENWVLFIKTNEVRYISIDDSGHLYAVTSYNAIYRTKNPVE